MIRALRVALLAVVLAACKSNAVEQSTVTVNESARCTGAFQHCDPGAAADACETNTSLDVRHCGACAKACSEANGRATCTEGRCSILCNAGFADCNGDPSDGCEVDTRSSLQHCGGCNSACTGDHATLECASGACRIASCEATWSDCDGSVATGCEIAPASDAKNCGKCGTSCIRVNGAGTCVAGACALTCSSGYHQCGDACSSDTSVTACGATCATCPAPAGGTPVCSAGACDFSCGTLTRCTDQCIDTKTNAAHCGVCNHGCDGGACGSGMCEAVAIGNVAPAPRLLRFVGSTLYAIGTQKVHRLVEPSTWTLVGEVPTTYNLSPGGTDGSAVYFSGYLKGAIPSVYVLARIDLVTGAFTELRRPRAPVDMTVGGDRVYWVEADCTGGCTSSLASIKTDGTSAISVPLTCSGPYMCESGNLLADATQIYLTTNRSGGGASPTTTRRDRTTLAVVETLPFAADTHAIPVALTPTYLYARVDGGGFSNLYRVLRSTNTLAPSALAITVGKSWFSELTPESFAGIATLADDVFFVRAPSGGAYHVAADGSYRGLIGDSNLITVRPTGKSEIFFSKNVAGTSANIYRLAR